MKATVYKSTGSWYILKDDAGITYNARLKGIFKIDGLGSTNPIAVGDTVTAAMENEGESTVTITDIGKRKNYLTRQSPANKNLHHIIASNLDQSLLFATLKDPKTSQGFIDRFLISSESFHLPAIIVFNKSDLHGRKEEEKFEGLKEMYEAIGYHVKKISVEKNQGLEDLSQMLKDKVTLISGHSGVGKSSFLNKIFPHINLKTQDVSDWSGKGMHTTTFAEMFDLPFGGKIIDTPGIRELGLVDISKQELSHYYPEMRLLLNNCQYNDCLHINEPNCAVKQAVESGKISPDRYISYRKIFDSIEENKY
jgi:ribosome biogenesis GTPase / thiamine phosphate phosphatase